MPDPRGDLPRRRKCTFSTVSCPLPRTTQICTFRQIAEGNPVTASNAAPVANVYNFTLGNLDGASQLSIWDQYRIDAIRFVIVPQNNAVQLVTNSSTSLVELYCVIDYDDSNSLTSTGAARKYDNCIILAPGESLERTFQPRMAVPSYSGTFSSFTNLSPQWIDTAYTGVQHYGVKIYIPTTTAAQTTLQSWNIQIEYYISFRSLLQ
jgi:hypothetical protein